jgi:hypothetical protein
VVLAAIVKVLLVNKGVVRLRGAVQEKVEARLSVRLPRYAVEPAVVEHLKAVMLQSALTPPATLEELPNLAEWARIDLIATTKDVLCCNIKVVLQVLFGMLQPRPARGRKRKAVSRPSRKCGPPKKKRPSERESESEVKSELDSESELETEREEEGDEGSDEDWGGVQEVMAVLDSTLYVARSNYPSPPPPPPPPHPQEQQRHHCQHHNKFNNHSDWEFPRSTTSPG